MKKKESLPKSEEELNEQEERARQELSTADEVLKDASAKLQKVCETKPMNISAVTAAEKMIDTAQDMRCEAMAKLDQVTKKQRSLHKATQKLLDEALPSRDSTQDGEQSKHSKDYSQQKGESKTSKDALEPKRKITEKLESKKKRVKKN